MDLTTPTPPLSRNPVCPQLPQRAFSIQRRMPRSRRRLARGSGRFLVLMESLRPSSRQVRGNRRWTASRSAIQGARHCPAWSRCSLHRTASSRTPVTPPTARRSASTTRAGGPPSTPSWNICSRGPPTVSVADVRSAYERVTSSVMRADRPCGFASACRTSPTGRASITIHRRGCPHGRCCHGLPNRCHVSSHEWRSERLPCVRISDRCQVSSRRRSQRCSHVTQRKRRFRHPQHRPLRAPTTLRAPTMT
jgi:hypothetical protein